MTDSPDPLAHDPLEPTRRDDPDAPVANAGADPGPVAGAADAVRPLGARDRTVHLIGNAHLDLVWLWTWQEGYQEARATFRSMVDRMDEHPDFVFTCDQVVLLAWVEEQDPELFARIRERVLEGRWVNTGGWWVEPDCNIPMGESFARQGLHGQRFLLSRFGRAATVGMNVDPFGQHAQLPQVLAGQGMRTYCFLRPMAHERALPSSLFRWRGPDGTEVVAYRIPFEYQSSREWVDRHVEKALAELPDELDPVMVFYGVGNHGGGPTNRQIDTIHRFDAMGSFGRLVLSSPADYFATVLDTPEAVAALPVVEGDLQHHAAGCYSAHSGIKQWQRRAQTALLVAERWAAVVTAELGHAYPREPLEHAWKQVLLNQFHDVLPGTAIEAAYEDARDQLGEAVAIAKRITARAHGVLAARIDLPLDEAVQPVVVFNPHPWPVTATVEVSLSAGATVDPAGVVDGEGAPLLAQTIASRALVGRRPGGAVAVRVPVPPLGHATVLLPDGPPRQQQAAPIARSATVLDNGVLRVEVDPASGWLRALTDLRTGVDLVAGATGPHLQVCADPTDTWGHRVVSYAWPGTTMPVTAVRLREDGPLRAGIRIERAWRSSTLVEELLLTAGSDALEVRVTLDWREPMHLLKLRVPVALQQPEAWLEIPYGELQRPVDGTEQPGQSWVDLSGVAPDGSAAGLALVNDAKHGYDCSPARDGASPSLGVTVVRSPPFAWHDPTTLDPEAPPRVQDQGEQRFTYLLVPHAGDRRQADLHRRAAELGMPVRAMLESFHPGTEPRTRSHAEQGTGSVVVTALKGAEDARADGGTDLVVRAVETQGVRAPFRFAVGPAVLEAELGPYEIGTWLLPRDAAPVRLDLLERPLAG